MPKKNENPPPKKCGTAIHESVEIGAEKMSVILKADIKRKLKEIGLESGDNVIRSYIAEKHGLCMRRGAGSD